jgi:hypothetical protein
MSTANTLGQHARVLANIKKNHSAAACQAAALMSVPTGEPAGGGGELNFAPRSRHELRALASMMILLLFSEKQNLVH